MKVTELTAEQFAAYDDGAKKLIAATDNVVDLIKTDDKIHVDGIHKSELLHMAQTILSDLKSHFLSERASVWTYKQNSDDRLRITFVNKYGVLIELPFYDYIMLVMRINASNFYGVSATEEQLKAVSTAIKRIVRAIQNEIQLFDIPTQVEKGSEMASNYMMDIATARYRFETALRDALWKNGKPNAIIATIADHMIRDTKNHYVTVSQEDPGKISYAKDPAFKTNSDKRIKTTMSKYIKRHYKSLYNAIGVGATIEFERDFNECYNKLYGKVKVGTNHGEVTSQETEGYKDEDVITKRHKKKEDVVIKRNNLIHAMKEGLDNRIVDLTEEEEYVIREAINQIEADSNAHYLALSSDDQDMVSYAKNKEDRFNPDKRIRLYLKRYIEKYIMPNISHNLSEDELENLLVDYEDFVWEELDAETVAKTLDTIRENAEAKTLITEDEEFPEIASQPEYVSKPESNNFEDLKRAIKELESNIKISSNRKTLIEGMKRAAPKVTNYTNISHQIINHIESNEDAMLSLSQDDVGRVSYAKTAETKFDNNKRVKINLSRYIEKYIYPDMYGIMGKSVGADVKRAFRTFEQKTFQEIDNIEREKREAATKSKAFAKDIYLKQKKPKTTKIEITLDNVNVIDKMNEVSENLKAEFKLQGDRELLLDALAETVAQTSGSPRLHGVCREVNDLITRDTNRHFLSLSQDNEGKVSYAKQEHLRYNNEKRTKNDFYKYLKKYIKPNISGSYNGYLLNGQLKKIADQTIKNVAELQKDSIYEEEVKTEKKTEKVKEDVPNLFEDLAKPKQRFETQVREANGRVYSDTFEYLSNGEKKLVNAQEFLNGKQVADIHFYHDGKVKSDCLFTNGIVSRKTTYFDNGVIKSIIYYKNGVLHDPTTDVRAVNHYNRYGLPIESISCKEGLTVIQTEHFNDGSVKDTSYYHDTGAIGVIKNITHYDASGNLVDSTNYSPNGEILNTTVRNAGEPVQEKIKKAILEKDKREKLRNTALEKEANAYTKVKKTALTTGALAGGAIPAAVALKKETGFTRVKKEASSAGYRIAANQISKGVRRAIVTLMKETGMSDTKLKHVEDVLDSEVGLAIISTMMGYSLTYSKYQDERIQRVASEFRAEGMATAGNAMIDEAMKYIVPAIKEHMNEIPDDKFRVEEAKQVERQDEVVEMDELDNQQQEVA